MKADFKKAVAVAVAAGVLAAGSLAASPAAAGGYYGQGRGYGQAGYGWGHRGWGHQGWGHRHGGWGAPVAAGVLGALAVGAAVGASQYGYYGGYRPCYPANQPITDDWGNVIAYQRVQVCN
ncbi:MAG: hypothetical protein C3F11_15480 [Methylocystaceae bacterium]|nr:MAG: hypothetical protein C3F11_15480 [Methylocystaceae bacterium]